MRINFEVDLNVDVHSVNLNQLLINNNAAIKDALYNAVWSSRNVDVNSDKLVLMKVNLERKVATINVTNSSKKRCKKKKKKKNSGNTTTNTETSSLVVGVISLIIKLKNYSKKKKDLNCLQCSKAFFVNTFEIAFQTGALQIIQKFF